ncbi:oxidoreductase [Halapricum sp. CBA1109]|uniref:proton-conducting transporter transmembrane domain-containing protein n=1 Tax=Halapricum sp. CBA1109 TaxID=2668068 RepID=UPI0012F9C288|nr:proton-conducting transporter membrane subunit [Halapricum sp. CBA1109]MUV88578.1 oxidoreductase [Halapricum sp. CBA1109]
MTGDTQATTVGELPTPDNDRSRVPTALTRAVWLLWAASLGVLAAYALGDGRWAVPGLLAVDGLTVVLWVTVTFFSAIVHSYSRRYMAGTRTADAFFGKVFAFTLVVSVLVAADSVVLFAASWLAMGLLMAELIGHAEGWPQAQAAGATARKHFLASSALVGVAVAALWAETGASTVSGIADGLAGSSTLVLLAAGALLLAAMVQSALLPFHTWLLSSMTAPTPASALMHAGFVNAGGVLLVRFAPVVTVEAWVMLVVVVVGAVSALGGKLLKTVRPDVKSKLGCSTVGQMGFMIVQAGLGFFGAAITHLILHGFYKAYQFLAAGEQVDHESPAKSTADRSRGPLGAAVVALTAIAGGLLFAVLTGKGTELGTGLLLVGIVVLTVLTAAGEVVTRASLPAAVRYGAVPLVALPAIAVYGLAYNAVSGLLAGLPAVGHAAELTPVHGLVGVAFLGIYLAIETGLYRRSERLYVALYNAGQPASETLLTATEDYNEY